MVIFLSYAAAVFVCGCFALLVLRIMSLIRFLFRSSIAASIGMSLLGIFSIFAFAHDRVTDIFVVVCTVGDSRLFDLKKVMASNTFA